MTQAAATLARLLGARLELFHVVTVPSFLGPDLLNEEVVTDLRQAADAMLTDHAARVKGDDLIVTTTLRVGTADELWYHARDCGAVALVIGTHARTGAVRFLLGSFAERTLTSVSCPILVVPPQALGRMVTGEPFTSPFSLLVGVDKSPASDAALAWVSALRRRRSCDVGLLHLYRPAAEHDRLGIPAPSDFEIDREVVAVLTRELNEHIVPQLGEALPIRVRPNWGGEDDPLAWEAETDQADLLVIGTSQTRRSSARATVRGSRVPVLCVPGRGVVSEGKAAPTFRSMLLVVDFTGPLNFVSDACHQLLPHGGGIFLVHVLPSADGILDGADTDEIETCLLGLVPAADADRYHAQTFVTAHRSRGEAIVKAIRRFAPDVVVMSAPPAGSPAELSVSIDYVARNSPKPLVLLPAARPRSDA